MANWRTITLDKAIKQAVKRGFHDPDFAGWLELPAEDRILFINTIIEHNGVGSIIFRKSFAKHLWGDLAVSVAGALLPAYLFHLQQMVVAATQPTDQDSWLQYLRDNI